MRKWKWLSLLLLIVLFVSVGATPATAQSVEKVRVLISFTQLPGQAEQAIVRGAGGEIGHTFTHIPTIAARVPETAIAGLLRNPRINHIEEDAIAYAIGETLPWGVDRIDAEVVHAAGNQGAGVKIAIVDTGIGQHNDLAVQGGHRFLGAGLINDENYTDDNGHGTHCAGIAAALDNDIGVIGVAPGASLYAVKVLDSSGSGYYSDIIAGIEWCITNGIQVISMSLGGSTDSDALKNICDVAYYTTNGIIVVAAAGNSGNPPGRGDTIEYPARYASVIAVAATDQNDSRAKWSSTGAAAELSAPGVSIYSTYKNNSYATLSGTSMACPHVSGVAALVKFSDSTLTNVDVRERLKVTADDLGATGWDSLYGYGLVDADEAAGVSAPPPPPPPPPPPGEATAYLSIDITTANKIAGPNVFTYAVASVTVLDAGDKPIAGTTVSGQWSNLTNDSDSVLTDANGVAVIQSDAVKNVGSGAFTFTVKSITKDGVSYNLDGEKSDSVTF